MKENPTPAVGQIWQDIEPDGEGGRLTIVAINGSRARVRTKSGLTLTTKLHFFGPDSTSYQYVGDVA